MTNGDKVTLRDVYEAIGDLRSEMSGRIDKVEVRVGILEDLKGRILGGVAIISMVFGVVFSWLWERLTKEI
jgi:hypothetical protein